jgi:hypothetical protein
VEAPPDKSTAREIVEGALEAAVGLVPIAGGPLGVALQMAMGWAYNKRLQAWLQDIAEAITELQDTVEGWPSFDELAQDDVFVDAVIHASRAAQATHQAEKLRALRNAVLNSLGTDAPDMDEQARFFRLIQEFTAAHVRLLAFLDDPGGTFDTAGIPRPSIYMGSRASLLPHLPDFAGRPDSWIDLLFRDLSDAALTNQGGLKVLTSDDAIWQPGTTALGRSFLSFVTTPDALGDGR